MTMPPPNWLMFLSGVLTVAAAAIGVWKYTGPTVDDRTHRLGEGTGLASDRRRNPPSERYAGF